MRTEVVLLFSLIILFGATCAFDIAQDLKDFCLKSENKPHHDISPACLDQLKIVCSHPALFYSLFDATSKYPYVGMNYSSNFDYGNYRYCHSIDFTDKNGQQVLGKHCAMSVAVPILLANLNHEETNSRMIDPSEIDRLIAKTSMQLDMFRSKSKDHIFSFNISLLALCIPDACTPTEAVDFFIKLPKVMNKLVGEHVPCTTKETYKEWTTGSKWTLGAFAAIIGIAAISTFYDIYLHYSDKKPIHMVTRAYSMLYNFRKIITVVPPKDKMEDISCLNGFRTVSMIWIVVWHTTVAWSSVQVVNKVQMNHIQNEFHTFYMPTAHVAVDTFFFISGLLLGFTYLKKMKNTSMIAQIKNIPYFYFHRYLRITPAAAAIYFWCRYIMFHLSEGPIWSSYGKHITASCGQYWWSYFLYVQNYVNPDKLCLSQTWYLSADMQMFVLSPIILIPASVLIKKRFKTIMIFMGVITVTSIVVPLIIRFKDHPGYDTYDTHSRLVDYFIGLSMGFYLRQHKNSQYPLNKLWNFIIWVFFLTVMIAVLCIYMWVLLNDTDFNNALFFGVYRPIWCLGLSWIVFSCYYGYGGFVNWFLSSPTQILGARLSYSLYLVHDSLIFVYFGSMAGPMYYSEWTAYYAWCGHIINATIMALFWNLLFESPILTIEKLLFSTAASKPQLEQAKNIETIRTLQTAVNIKESID